MPEFVPAHASSDEATAGPHGGVHMARALQARGVDTIFALCGAHILPLLDAAPDHGIRIVDVRTEGSATMAAEGYALATGTTGVAAVTAGPGFANALLGVIDAGCWSVPMLFFAGRTGLHQTGKGAVFDIPQREILAPITKENVYCVETGRIGLATAEAMYKARVGKPGPVYLEIPQDVFMDRAADPAPPVPQGYPVEPPRIAADPVALDAALDALAQAERPVILAGSGAFWAGATEELARFAEVAQIPVTTTSAGRGVLPDSHPWCLGTLIHAGVAVLGADVVLVLGSQFNANVAFGNPPLFPDGGGQRVIQVDVRPESIGGNHLPDIPVVGDVKQVLADLSDGWRKTPPGRAAWLTKCREDTAFVRSMWDAQIEGHDAERLHHGKVARDIVDWARERIGSGVTFVADGGDAMTWMIAYAYAEGPGRLMATTTALGTLGVGMPFAIAAKAARPDEPVILFAGDGAFGISAMEIDTAVRHNLPVIAVVSNNYGWRDVSHEHDMWFGPGKRYGSELADVRYDKLAEALGAHGEHVTTYDELVPALERALASGRTAVINVATDPEVLSDLLRNVGDMGII